MAEPELRKSTGESEPFRERKLRRSLARSGAARAQVREIVAAVKARLRDGMPTNEVFRIAHAMLRRERRDTAARYSLQRAILQLGPDGFPFEEFVAELWRHQGMRVRTGVRLRGRFVRHEVDVVGRAGSQRQLAECKFRGQQDGKVDVKVALYVRARAIDLEPTGYERFWLVTNGRFTADALTYGHGVGLSLLAWNHPRGDGLRERIDRAGLHPVTALSSLQRDERSALLRRGIVLAAALREQRGVVAELGLSRGRARALWEEIDSLCPEA